MSRPKLTVHRKSFHVRATIFKKGGKAIHRKSFEVSPSVYKIKDIGAPGRGEKVIPPLKKGHAKVMAGFMKTQNFKPRIFKSTTVLRNKDFNKKFPYVICCEKRKRM